MRKVTEIIDFLGVEVEVTTNAPGPAVIVAPQDALAALRVGFTIESEAIASGPILAPRPTPIEPELQAPVAVTRSCEQLYLLRPAQGLPSRQEGLREVRVAQVPILGPTFCFSSPSEPPCTTRTFGHQKWFVGSGIRAEDHPVVRDGYEFFAKEILRSGCGACNSLEVSVLAFASGASMGGTTNYALEVRCPCGAYTSYGYSDD